MAYKKTSRLTQKINHQTLCKYLSLTGWIAKNTLRSGIIVWLARNGDTVLVPTNKEYADYQDLLSKAITEIALHMAISTNTLISNIYFINCDILKFRFPGPETKDGTIPFPEWFQYAESLKDVLLSSHKFVESPSMFHPKVKNKDSERWLSNCKMGQTEVGSYVTNVILPLEQVTEERQLSLFPEEKKPLIPTTRKISKSIIYSASKIAQASQNNTVEELIEENQKSLFVSANICNAFLHLFDSSQSTDVSIEAKWSTLFPEEQFLSKVTLRSSYKTNIERISTSLVPQSPPRDETYSGFVLGVQKNPQTPEEEGLVKILVQEKGGKTVTLHAKLSPSVYPQAINAHAEGRIIQITGTLNTNAKGKRQDISPVTSFKVL